jgi:hypothetical protein
MDSNWSGEVVTLSGAVRMGSPHPGPGGNRKRTDGHVYEERLQNKKERGLCPAGGGRWTGKEGWDCHSCRMLRRAKPPVSFTSFVRCWEGISEMTNEDMLLACRLTLVLITSSHTLMPGTIHHMGGSKQG